MADGTLLIDTHNDLPWRCRQLEGGDWSALRLDRGDRRVHTDIPRLRAGGVGAQFWSVFVDGALPGHEALTATLEQMDVTHRLLAAHPDVFVAALTADDVESAFADGRIASLIGVEGGHSIASSLPVLRMVSALGARYLTLTHNEHVPWADSAARPERLGGLSPFGREVVREMNRLGILVDLSHTSAGTMRDALETSVAPVIFTHSGARSLTDHPRNVPDDVLRTLAAGGGVCCATFVPSFCSTERYAWEQETRQRVVRAGIDPHDHTATTAFVAGLGETPPPVGVREVADHVDRLREVAGVDHVGIGGDFDGTSHLPEGLEDVTGYPRLFDELRSRGWSAADLDRLAGRNVLRVLRAAEDVARGLADTPPSLATIAELDGQPGEISEEFAVLRRTPL